MNLDIPAAVGCGLIALCVFGVHVVSSPKSKAWITLPEYVRRSFLLTGLMFFWRSVNLASIASAPVPLGHANAEGMMAQIALVYMIGACTFCYVRAALKDHQWERIQNAAKVAQNRDMVPVMLHKSEVAETLRALGAVVVEAESPPAE